MTIVAAVVAHVVTVAIEVEVVRVVVAVLERRRTPIVTVASSVAER